MSGIIDGVSKLWVMRYRRGALDLAGFATNLEAVEQLVRIEMVADDSEANKARIRAAVEFALKHMDECAEEPSDG
jgi:hypothetical protein